MGLWKSFSKDYEISRCKWDPDIEEYDICYVLCNGWNGLNEVLPILVWLKEHRPACKILTIAVEYTAGWHARSYPRNFQTIMKFLFLCQRDVHWTLIAWKTFMK